MNRQTHTGRRVGAIAYMVSNSVAANLLMVVFIVGGLLFAGRVKQEVFPEFDLDMVIVSVPYPGASPEEIEQGILLAIEEAVRDVDGVDTVSSTANEGNGQVVVELLLGTDRQRASQDVQNALDRITSFPEEAERPRVTIASRRNQVLDLLVYGDVAESDLRSVAEEVRDGLQQDPDITYVDLDGIRPLEISIEIPQRVLRTYGLTLAEVARRIRATSVELPGGGIKTEGGEILLRMQERRDLAREFGSIPIVTTPEGTVVLLEELADIRDAFEDVDRYDTFQGHSAIGVRVYRVGEETPLTVSAAVHRYVESVRDGLPPGVGLKMWWDMSDIYRQRINLLLRNAMLGLILVFLLLGLFLEARLAFWVMLGIPISFLGTFIFLPMFGVSISMVSLFAFIISLGIVVDDAIVVGENVYELHQEGLPFRQAAAEGAHQMLLPVSFAILTNMVAFMPMFFVPGMMGKIFKVIPAVVVTTFAISWIESLFILPAHLAHQKDVRHRGWTGRLHRLQQRFAHAVRSFIQTVYGPFLTRALSFRYVVIAASAAILMLTLAVIRGGFLGFEMFPKIEGDLAQASVRLPHGTSVERTEQVRDRLVAAAESVAREVGGEAQVEGIYATVGTSGAVGFFDTPGSGGSHLAAVMVLMTDPDQRPIPTSEFTERWAREVGEIPGVESLQFQDDAGNPGSGPSITVELSHRDLDVLEAASDQVAKGLRNFPNVRSIDSGWSAGKDQLDFEVRETGRSLGLTSAEVARQVRNSFFGAEAIRQQRGRNEMKIMVRLPEEERESEYHLEELILRTPGGVEIPLREAVVIEQSQAYTAINRREGRRIVTATATSVPRSQAGLILSEMKAGVLAELMDDYPGLQISFEGQQAEMQESMSGLMVGFAFAMLGLYALLAVPFRSYVQPLIVMFSIPFGLVGAVIGHWIMDYSLSMMSMFGVVALSGVVINDSLILIDYANRARRAGASAREAIERAGVRRFRPIILTTLTTFGGLAPMIMETSLQAKFLIPMAISLGYGILFATTITLLLVPSLYLVVEDVSAITGNLWHGRLSATRMDGLPEEG